MACNFSFIHSSFHPVRGKTDAADLFPTLKEGIPVKRHRGGDFRKRFQTVKIRVAEATPPPTHLPPHPKNLPLWLLHYALIKSSHTFPSNLESNLQKIHHAASCKPSFERCCQIKWPQQAAVVMHSDSDLRYRWWFNNLWVNWSLFNSFTCQFGYIAYFLKNFLLKSYTRLNLTY